MAKDIYFTITNGLRGCYMPDSSEVYHVTSFKQFSAEIKERAGWLQFNRPNGLRQAWRIVTDKRESLPLCVSTSPRNPSYGLLVGRATESEFAASQLESGRVNV